MAREPSFYGQRPDAAEKSDSGKHTGPEQRKVVRRKNQDRREEVRFEIEKEDRRTGFGRRDDDHVPKYW